MNFRVEITGDVSSILEAERRAGANAVKAAMGVVGNEIKLAWRGQISGAGLGTRLSNTIRVNVYPKGAASLNAAALIYTKAPKLIGVFERGVTIKSLSGFWLAIPLPAAGKGAGGKRLTPGEWERRRGVRLRFVYRRTGASLLVADGRQNSQGLGVKSGSKTGLKRATVPIFALVRQVTLRKRLSLYPAAERIAGSLPGRIVSGWRSVS